MQSATSRAHYPGRRPGLTLVELLVVLTILIALAGILIPLLPNVLTRTQQSTDATQINELARAIQSYQSAFNGYPDGYDLLTDGTANFPGYMPTATVTTGTGTSTLTFGGYVEAKALTGPELTALFNAGIQFVQPMASVTTGTDFQATLFPYPTGSTIISNRVDVSTAAGAALIFAVIDPANNTNIPTTFLQVPRAADTTLAGRYVLFGIGSRCSMVSRTIQEAPVGSPINRFATPANTYFRYGVIYQVSGSQITGTATAPISTPTARFIATVSMETGVLQTAEQNVVNLSTQSQN